ncbi:arrestin domain-containing protein [Tieghemostelium lacteum]|uniref:Arrestin domain-containing protein n=1 Tax=Tieghemostelium lacteum TaxID=361077 RepID=A0A151Z3J2_TIELA|nr:arrestin domain-containing protein [Tieghemostelium lacteum]|eukprot:KYQ88487.1 arrestin domain-containing protein [Tieghemostelium lacteum]
MDHYVPDYDQFAHDGQPVYISIEGPLPIPIPANCKKVDSPDQELKNELARHSQLLRKLSSFEGIGCGDEGDIKVKLDNGYWIAGQSVFGRVEINLKEDVKSMGINIKWKAFEHVFFSQFIKYSVHSEGETPNEESKKLQKKRTLYKSIEQIYQSDDSGVIPKGFHIFPFHFQIPSHLPSSFVDFNQDKVTHDKLLSSILYHMSVQVENTSLITRKGFVVTHPSTIAAKVNEMPLKKEKKKTFLTSNGALTMKVHIKKNVFLPGEAIPIQLSLINATSKNIKHIKVTLKRVLNITSEPDLRKQYHCKIVQEFTGTPSHSSSNDILNFTGTDMVKYSTPTTKGNLIQCQYQLSIKCFIKRALNVTIKFDDLIIAYLPSLTTNIILDNDYNSM